MAKNREWMGRECQKLKKKPIQYGDEVRHAAPGPVRPSEKNSVTKKEKQYTYIYI